MLAYAPWFRKDLQENTSVFCNYPAVIDVFGARQKMS